MLFVASLKSSWITGVIVVTIIRRLAFSSESSESSFSRRSWNSSSVDFSSSEYVLFNVCDSNQSASTRATSLANLVRSEINSDSSFNCELINQLWKSEINNFSRSNWYCDSLFSSFLLCCWIKILPAPCTYFLNCKSTVSKGNHNFSAKDLL